MSAAPQRTRIAIAGSSGRMGRMLLEAVTQDEQAMLAAALEIAGSPDVGRDAGELIGAHRGMTTLAGEIAALGHPVFRFDRRGIGDSEGMNGGFLSCGPDIDAAIAAFRAHCPQLTRIIAFGNCDAASALVLNGPTGLSGLVLANPWVIERINELPTQAAIRVRYGERLSDPKAWIGLFTGAIDLPSRKATALATPAR